MTTPKDSKQGSDKMQLPINRQQVIDALLHHWSIDANNIQVGVSGNTIILKGFVHTKTQKEEAEKVARKTPGVIAVENRLYINTDS